MFDSAPEKELNNRDAVSAARQGAGRHQLDQRHGVYARRSRPTTTTGASSAARAGTGIPSCPSSRRPRTTNAARTNSMASAARCGSPTRRRSGRSARRWSRPPCRPASRAPPTSTARRRKAPATTRPPPTTRAAGVPPRPICARRATRQNLTVVTEAHATRVLIENGRAVGVEYRTPQGLRTARARGEVIVSGGTYGSPHLLQLSGLGPADLLNETRHHRGARHAGCRRQPARPLQHLQRLSAVAARHTERPGAQHAAQAASPACSMRSAGAA